MGQIACKNAGCENLAQTRGYCRHHYQLAWAREEFNTRPRCSFKKCGRPISGHGLCSQHLDQKSRGVELHPIGTPKRRWKPPALKCSFPKCGRMHLALGFCKQHYRQKKRGENLKEIRTTKKPSPLPEEIQDLIKRRANLPELDGRSVFLSWGYPHFEIWEKNKPRRFRIHRLVMERKIGRQLLPAEVVHHINHG